MLRPLETEAVKSSLSQIIIKPNICVVYSFYFVLSQNNFVLNKESRDAGNSTHILETGEYTQAWPGSSRAPGWEHKLLGFIHEGIFPWSHSAPLPMWNRMCNF